MHVIEGVGGAQKLGDDDKADIRKTIDNDVLQKKAIEFRSIGVSGDGGGGLVVTGDLTMSGKSKPLDFVVTEEGGKLAGRATINQTDWGIKPYSALVGALKVNDDVTRRGRGQPAGMSATTATPTASIWRRTQNWKAAIGVRRACFGQD